MRNTMSSSISLADMCDIENTVREMLPLLLQNKAFLEELHLQAVQMEREGNMDSACRLYRLVQDNAEPFPQLQSWAFFKEAEQLLRAGQDAAGRQLLRRVLALHPGHTKARLLLQAATDRLTVAVGAKPSWPCPGFFVAFNCFDLRLWDYYFAQRPVDSLWLVPPFLALDLGVEVLEPVIERHLAKDGEVVFALHPSRTLTIGRLDMLDMLSRTAQGFQSVLRDRLAVLVGN